MKILDKENARTDLPFGLKRLDIRPLPTSDHPAN